MRFPHGLQLYLVLDATSLYVLRVLILDPTHQEMDPDTGAFVLRPVLRPLEGYAEIVTRSERHPPVLAEFGVDSLERAVLALWDAAGRARDGDNDVRIAVVQMFYLFAEAIRFFPIANAFYNTFVTPDLSIQWQFWKFLVNNWADISEFAIGQGVARGTDFVGDSTVPFLEVVRYLATKTVAVFRWIAEHHGQAAAPAGAAAAAPAPAAAAAAPVAATTAAASLFAAAAARRAAEAAQRASQAACAASSSSSFSSQCGSTPESCTVRRRPSSKCNPCCNGAYQGAGVCQHCQSSSSQRRLLEVVETDEVEVWEEVLVSTPMYYIEDVILPFAVVGVRTVVRDFNSDGREDVFVVARNNSRCGASLHFATGVVRGSSRIFSSAACFPYQLADVALTLADFDADGNVDYLLRNMSGTPCASNQYAVLFGTRDGVVSDPVCVSSLRTDFTQYAFRWEQARRSAGTVAQPYG